MNESQSTTKDELLPWQLSPDQLCFLHDLKTHSLGVKLPPLRYYAELAELLARDIIAEEVQALAGARCSREKTCRGRYGRWSTNPGSILIGEKRPLESYQQMKRPTAIKPRWALSR